MPCGCFGTKKKLKQAKLDDIDSGKNAAPIGKQPMKNDTGVNDAKNDDPSKKEKRRDVVASHYGDECALLGYRNTSSRPPSSAIDSPQNSHTPSTAPLLSSSPPSSGGGSPTNSRGRSGAISRAELEEKRREFFSDLSPLEQKSRTTFPSSDYAAQPSFNTLPTQAKAKQFGEVKPLRPSSQPGTVSLDGDSTSVPPGPHLLHATPPPPPPLPPTDGVGFASKAFISELKCVSEGISKRWANEPTVDDPSPSGLKMKPWTKGETFDDDWVVVPEETLPSPLDGSYVFTPPAVKPQPPQELKISTVECSNEPRPSESPIPATLVTPPSPPVGYSETSISSPISHSLTTNDSGIDEQPDEQMPADSTIGWTNNVESSFQSPDVISVQHVSTTEYEQEVPSSLIANLESAPEFDANVNSVPVIEQTTILNFESTNAPRVEFTSQISDHVESRIPTVEEIADDFVETVNKPVPILTQHNYTVTEPDDLSDRVSGDFGNICDISEEFSDKFKEVPVRISEQVVHVKEEVSSNSDGIQVRTSKLVEHITEEVVDKFDNISEKVYRIDEPSTQFMEVPVDVGSSQVDVEVMGVSEEVKFSPVITHTEEEFVSNQINELKNQIFDDKELLVNDFNKGDVDLEQYGSHAIENGNHIVESATGQVNEQIDLLSEDITAAYVQVDPVSIDFSSKSEIIVEEPEFTIDSELSEKEFEQFSRDLKREIIDEIESVEPIVTSPAQVEISSGSVEIEQSNTGKEVNLIDSQVSVELGSQKVESDILILPEVPIPAIEASIVTTEESEVPEVFDKGDFSTQISTSESQISTEESQIPESREPRGSLSDESPNGESPTSNNEEESSISVSESSSTTNQKKSGKRSKRKKNKK